MKLHSHILGSGEPIVLLHGLLASGNYWNRTVDALDTTTHQVLTIDLLGFGQSPKPTTGYTIENYTDLILQTIRGSGIQAPITLVGHSMGSLVATYIAQQHPKLIKKLVLISPPLYESSEQALKSIESESTYTKLFRKEPLARVSCWVMCHMHAPLRVIIPLIQREVPKQVALDVLQHNWHSYSGVLNNIILDQDYLKKSEFKIPTTILYGSKDRLVVPENIINFSDSATIKKIDTGHHIPLDHAKSVVEAIKSAQLSSRLEF